MTRRKFDDINIPPSTAIAAMTEGRKRKSEARKEALGHLIEDPVSKLITKIKDDDTFAEEILDEALRLLAPHSLEHFVQYVYGFEPARHHKIWCDTLSNELLSDKHIILVAPFGHAKTMYVQAFITWMIGRDPSHRFLYAARVAQMARRNSISMRAIIGASERYKEIFPTVQRDPNRAWTQLEWNVRCGHKDQKNPTFLGSGCEGPVLGIRCDDVILDDICSMENMSTDDSRKNVRDWVEHTCLPRATHGRAISISTRWHEEDIVMLFEEIEQSNPGKVHFCVMEALGYWEKIQGIALEDDTKGSPLWPEWVPLAELLALRRKDERAFELMYQGRATIAGGDVFKMDKFRRYNPETHSPLDNMAGLRMLFMSWDTAQGTDSDADYSAGTLWAVTDRDIYLIDAKRGKWAFPQLVKEILDWVHEYKVPKLVVEDINAGKAFIQSYTDYLAFQGVEVVPRSHQSKNKRFRAQGVTGIINLGMVNIPSSSKEKYEWVPQFWSEVEKFDLGKHDDWVDSMVHALAYIRDSDIFEDEPITFFDAVAHLKGVIPDVEEISDPGFGFSAFDDFNRAFGGFEL